MASAAALLDLPPVTPAYVRVTGAGHDQAVGALAAAECALGEHRYAEAIAALGDVHVPSASAPDLALRVLNCETWSRLYLGELETADALAERARALSEGTSFTDADRADALFRLGAVRLKRSRVSNAVSLFTLAVRLGERGGPAGERVCSQALEWRSRRRPPPPAGGGGRAGGGGERGPP